MISFTTPPDLLLILRGGTANEDLPRKTFTPH